MHGNIIAASALAFGFACASQQRNVTTLRDRGSNLNVQENPTASNDAKGKFVCTYQTNTGTHIPERTCRYQDQIDVERQQTQDKLIEQKPVQQRQGG